MNPTDINKVNLVRALADIRSTTEMQCFLEDVMTKTEIEEIASRLQVAIMLDDGIRYAAITQATGLSSRTVARISEWLKKGTGGYKKAIEIINSHYRHL